MASCLSALPSASCAAIAETYARAIIAFGGAAFGSGGYVLATKVSVGTKHPLEGVRRFLLNVLLFLSVCTFLAAILAGGRNLQQSTMHCFVGQPTEATLHERIPLAGILDVSMWFDWVWNF
jgi:hypothetical protein